MGVVLLHRTLFLNAHINYLRVVTFQNNPGRVQFVRCVFGDKCCCCDVHVDASADLPFPLSKLDQCSSLFDSVQ